MQQHAPLFYISLQAIPRSPAFSIVMHHVKLIFTSYFIGSLYGGNRDFIGIYPYDVPTMSL